MNTVADISRTLKAAREAKGLSQRALAKLAGVPQSHISKIENAGVDLRISSLTQIARALDLELTLVPRKSVPAVRSIMRSAEPVSSRKTAASLAKELGRLEDFAHKIAQQQSSFKEAVQLQSRIHDLTRLEMPDSYLTKVEKLNNQLKLVIKEPEDLKRLVDSLDEVQALRNALVHSPSEELRQISRSAYSLEDDDG
ncbi:helix-turn-helix domain-containing protein [Marinobacter salarius]|uniref:helix-turn-helix domain-containing protein n=1 Tax=Marinobacter salarius TaxID=1420917 RepID=UPI0032EB5D98